MEYLLKKTAFALFFIAFLLAAGLGLPDVLYAQTTADCGRFFLKKNEQTGLMECVNKRSTRSRNRITAAGIQRRQQAVGRLLNQAQNLSQQQNLTDEDRRRIRELLSEADQRVKEIRQQTRQLLQDQETRTKALASEQTRRRRRQAEAARALEQQQKTLTLQLIAQQRQLAKDARGITPR